jgi:hypothetical protein
MDAAIIKTYRENSGNGEINALADKLGLPRWKVSRRALYLGVVEPKHKEPPWSQAEIRILTKWARLTPERIYLKLKACGYQRTYTAIVLKRKRLRLLSNLDGYTATSLKDAFGVDATTVLRWIRKGFLKAEKRGTKRVEVQGGDMWWIKEKDIRAFLIESINIVDIRKIDKYWLVDILAKNKAGQKEAS